jgi:hypothetical protein
MDACPTRRQVLFVERVSQPLPRAMVSPVSYLP